MQKEEKAERACLKRPEVGSGAVAPWRAARIDDVSAIVTFALMSPMCALSMKNHDECALWPRSTASSCSTTGHKAFLIGQV